MKTEPVYLFNAFAGISRISGDPQLIWAWFTGSVVLVGEEWVKGCERGE